MTQLKTC